MSKLLQLPTGVGKRKSRGTGATAVPCKPTVILDNRTLSTPILAKSVPNNRIFASEGCAKSERVRKVEENEKIVTKKEEERKEEESMCREKCDVHKSVKRDECVAQKSILKKNEERVEQVDDEERNEENAGIPAKKTELGIGEERCVLSNAKEDVLEQIREEEREKDVFAKVSTGRGPVSSECPKYSSGQEKEEKDEARHISAAVEKLVAELNFDVVKYSAIPESANPANAQSTVVNIMNDTQSAAVPGIVQGGAASASTGNAKSEDDKDSDDISEEIPEEEIATIRASNREFLGVRLGGQNYTALYDPGSDVSLINSKIAKKFRDRWKPNYTLLSGPFGSGAVKSLGTLPILLEIDGITKTIDFRILDLISHELLLRADFIRKFGVKTDAEIKSWRVSNESEWMKFLERDCDEEEIMVYAECAGIREIWVSEREQVQELVKRMVPEETETQSYTTLIEHHIDVQGARPFKHHPRRMSPKLLEIAKEEVKKMFREGVIQRSAS